MDIQRIEVICQIASAYEKSQRVLVPEKNIPSKPRVRREEVWTPVAAAVRYAHIISRVIRKRSQVD
jgi:hypothetical protein